jgi:radical SAM superfamily enzyme YgiQ (UPF0313 family)
MAADLVPDGIPGLGLRLPSGRIELRKRSAPLGRSELSHPLDLELVALPRWASFADRLHYVHFSRGCNWRCNFCCSPNFWGRRRLRDPEAVASELEALRRRGVRQVFVTDEVLIPGSAGFGAILDVLHRFGDMRFCGLMRPDHLDRVDPAALKEAHLDLIYLGIESFSPKVQRAMNKGLTTFGVRRMTTELRRMKGAGVEATLLIMLGYPGGSWAEDRKTVNACRRLAELGLVRDICVAHTAPLHGTALATDENSRYRLIETRTHWWNLSEPVIELVSRHGRVTYPAKRMRSVYQELEAIRVQFELGPHRPGTGADLGLDG